MKSESELGPASCPERAPSVAMTCPAYFPAQTPTYEIVCVFISDLQG